MEIPLGIIPVIFLLVAGCILRGKCFAENEEIESQIERDPRELIQFGGFGARKAVPNVDKTSKNEKDGGVDHSRPLFSFGGALNFNSGFKSDKRPEDPETKFVGEKLDKDDDSHESDSLEDSVDSKEARSLKLKLNITIGGGRKKKKPSLIKNEAVIRCNSSFELFKHPTKAFVVQSQYHGTDKQYLPQTNCRWLLKGNEKCTLEFQCASVDLRSDCTSEYLEIYDNGKKRASKQLCRRTAMSKPTRARVGHNLNVLFKTSASKIFKRLYKGFKCRVKCSKDPKLIEPLPPPTKPVIEETTIPELEVCGKYSNFSLASIRRMIIKSKSDTDFGRTLSKPKTCNLFVYGDEHCRVQTTCLKLNLQSDDCTKEFIKCYNGPKKFAKENIKLCNKDELSDPFYSAAKTKDNGILLETQLYPKYMKSGHAGFKCFFRCKPQTIVPVTPKPTVTVRPSKPTTPKITTTTKKSTVDDGKPALIQLCSKKKSHNLASKRNRTLIITSLKYGTGSNYPTNQFCQLDVHGDPTCHVQAVCLHFDFRPSECLTENLIIFNRVENGYETKLCGSTLLSPPWRAEKLADDRNGLRFHMRTSVNKLFNRKYKGFKCLVTCVEQEPPPEPPGETTTEGEPTSQSPGEPTPLEPITEEPTAPPTDEPTEPPTDEPTEPPTDEPTEPPTDEPTEPSSEEPTEPPTDEPAEPPTDEPTEPPTDEPTEPSSEEPTEPPTDEPTEPPTDEPTEPPTDEPTEPSNEEPTEPPTDEPTVPSSEEPTEPSTDEPPTEPSEPTEGPPEPTTPCIKRGSLLEVKSKLTVNICDYHGKNFSVGNEELIILRSPFFENEEVSYPPNLSCDVFIYGDSSCRVQAQCYDVDLRRKNCKKEHVWIYNGYEQWRTTAKLCGTDLLRDPFKAAEDLEERVPNGLRIKFNTVDLPFKRIYGGFQCTFRCETQVCVEDDAVASDEGLEENKLDANES